MAQYGVSFVAYVINYNASTGAYVTGDAANITTQWCKDGTNSATTNSVSEVSSANSPGLYKITMTATEATCTTGTLSGKSTTSNAQIIPSQYHFDSFTSVFPAGGVLGEGQIDSGTLQSATGTTAVIRSGASFADSRLIGMTLAIIGGTGVGQARVITVYVNSTKTCTVDTWTTTPDSTSVYVIYLTAGASASVPPSANVTQWNGTAVASPATAGIPDVNVKNAANTAWNSGAITRASFSADSGLQTIRSGTAQAGAAGTLTLDASASAVDNFYNNCLLYLTGGTGVGQARFITGYVGSTKVATANSNWKTTPDSTTTFAIVEFDAIPGATAPTAAQVATAVWQDATSGDFTVASSIGKSLYTTGNAPGAASGLAIVGSSMDVKSINSVSASSVTAVNANQGTTQPVNFTGTAGAALVKTDVTDIATVAVATGTAQLGVNLVNIAGSAVSTSTAQIGANLVNIGGSAVSTSTAQLGVNVVSSTSNYGIKKNTALNNYEFLMTDSTTHAPKTAVTVTAQRSIDGGAFASCANAVTELSNGIYKINLATTDLNGGVITLRFTGTSADDRIITIITSP